MVLSRRTAAGALNGCGQAPTVPGAAWRRLAEALCLAAAPAFAVMALLTGLPGGDPADVLCSTAQATSPLSGMAAMYGLMSAVHAAPWLKLIASRYPRSASGEFSEMRPFRETSARRSG